MWEKHPGENENKNFLWLPGGFQLSPVPLLWVGGAGGRHFWVYHSTWSSGRASSLLFPGFDSIHHPCWAYSQ